MNGVPETDSYSDKVKIVGVGGAGCRMVRAIGQLDLSGHHVQIDRIVLDMDMQYLRHESQGAEWIHIAVPNPEFHRPTPPETLRLALLNERDRMETFLKGAHLAVFVAGMGGFTGTMALPTIARMARDMGILTVAVVTLPFPFEGKQRQRKADSGLQALKPPNVDACIILSLERILNVIVHRNPTLQVFLLADKMVCRIARILLMLCQPCSLHEDDLRALARTLMQTSRTVLGFGRGSGEDMARNAVEQSTAGVALEGGDLSRAKGILIHVGGGRDLTLNDFHIVTSGILDAVANDTILLTDCAIEESMEQEIEVLWIATGLPAPSRAET